MSNSKFSGHVCSSEISAPLFSQRWLFWALTSLQLQANTTMWDIPLFFFTAFKASFLCWWPWCQAILPSLPSQANSNSSLYSQTLANECGAFFTSVMLQKKIKNQKTSRTEETKRNTWNTKTGDWSEKVGGDALIVRVVLTDSTVERSFCISMLPFQKLSSPNLEGQNN